MVLKRELSQPSPAATPARKVPRLVTHDLPLSADEVSTPPTTIVSPVDTEHAPSPPSSNDPYYAPQPQSFFHVQPAQLVARLEEMTKQYADAVDDAAVHVNRLRHQVSVARRQLESTPSWEQPPWTPSSLPVSYDRTTVRPELSIGSIDGAGFVERQGAASVPGAAGVAGGTSVMERGMVGVEGGDNTVDVASIDVAGHVRDVKGAAGMAGVDNVMGGDNAASVESAGRVKDVKGAAGVEGAGRVVGVEGAGRVEGEGVEGEGVEGEGVEGEGVEGVEDAAGADWL